MSNQCSCHLPKGPHHFPESLFCRNVILPNHCLADSNITGRNLTKSSNYVNFIMPNDIFRNRCSAELYFSESSYSRTPLSRIVVQLNDIFPEYHLPERHSPGIVYSGTSFHRTLCDLMNIYRVI